MQDTFSRALKSQLNVLGALVVLEAHHRFARRSIGLFEELASIGVHVAGFVVLRYLAGANTHYAMPAIPFMASGIFVFWMMRSNLMAAANFPGSKRRYPVMPKVTQLDVLIARCTVNTCLYLFIGAATFITFYFLGLGPIPKPYWMPTA